MDDAPDEAIERTLLPVARRAYAMLRARKCLSVPKDVSWRSAHILVARGVADLYPFERRWAGRLTLKARVGLTANRHPPIPVPKGGFASNEADAKWLEETLLMRMHEVLALAGVQNATIQPKGLYDLLLMSLNSATRRGKQEARTS